ncbi:MAG TPA: cytochrome c1 [Afifellaceae bacterium]|nr:cytochrome c1 [Afifellaceae bacterium]
MTSKNVTAWLAAAAVALLMVDAAGAQTEQAAGPPQVEELQHYPLREPLHIDWTFDGPFGSYDRRQLQRGFQVYREVCAACHALSYVAFRNLGEPGGPGFGEAEVRALAAEYMVQDGPDDSGEMFERPAVPSDTIPPPFANAQAARAANGGAYPPDLSLITKARAVERGLPWFLFDIFTQYQETGSDYLYSLLVGYQEPPEGTEVQPGLYYNPYFISGSALAMPPPLSDGVVSYAQNQDEDAANDVPETVEQYARDVTAFLMWAAEPNLEARKRMGFSVMGFLILFAGLVFYTKKKVWDEVGH